MTRYEPVQSPRFRKELLPGGYEFVVPARKNWFALLFLPVWLTGWTFGGVMAITQFMISREPFLALWLIGWVFGWVFAAGTIAYMLTGAEVIRVTGGDLAIGKRILGYNFLKHFRGSDIRKLAARDGPGRMFGWPQTGSYLPGKSGSIRFDHGARTLFVGENLDRPEAELIVADLLRTLPGAA